MPRPPTVWTIHPRYAGRVRAADLRAIVSGQAATVRPGGRQGRRARRFLVEPHRADMPMMQALVCRGGLQRQWQVCCRLQECTIATLPPVALGTAGWFAGFRPQYLLREHLPGARPLADVAGAGQARADLLSRFSDLMRAVRQVALVGSDFHWGDVLVKNAGQEDERLCIAGVHKLRLLPGLPHDTRAGYLLRGLLLWLPRASTLSDALRAGAPQRAPLGQPLPQAAVQAGLRGRMRGDVPETALADLLLHAGAVPDARVLKDSRTTTVVRQDWLLLKRYNPKGALYHLKHLVRPSRARRVWQCAVRAFDLGLPTPEPLAWAERWRRGVLRESFLVTRALHGAAPLQEWATRCCAAAGRETKRAAVAALARAVRAMHDQGLVHGDLKSSNILVQGGLESPRFCFIDLDAARFTVPGALRGPCRDLARLNASFPAGGLVSQRDRLRFLLVYSAGMGRARVRQMLHETLGRTQRKLRKRARSGLPVV